MARLSRRVLLQLGRGIGEGWYANAETCILRVGDGCRETGAALLAATSPRCALIDNVRRALRRTSSLPAHIHNLRRVPGPLSGPKVEAFRRALLGDTTAVPWDVWMLRAYNLPERAPPAEVRAGTLRLWREADYACLHPRDYAASIWCGIILSRGREPLTYNEALHRLTAQETLRLPLYAN